MAKRVLITGATGNQGGSVAKLLLRSPSEFIVRALTRNANSPAAIALREEGAEIFQGDLTEPTTLERAFKDCWGAFVATNFYDSSISDDPSSEETQGRNAADAALKAGVQCFVWSTLPSALEISNGRISCEIYDGKHRVDSYIRGIGLPSVFVYTGNFYENQIYRSHVVETEDGIEFRQPVIKGDVKLHMLWVERDLAAIVEAIFQRWEQSQSQLMHKYLYAMDAVRTPNEICAIIEQVTGKPTKYVVLDSTGNSARDAMFNLYNLTGTYPGVILPDPNVLSLGVQLHGAEQFIRERLVPHLQRSRRLS